MKKPPEKNELVILHLVYLRFWSAIAWHALGMATALQRRGHRCWIAGAPGSPVLAQGAASPLLSERAVALPCLRHRLVLNFEGQAENIQPDMIVGAVVGSVLGGGGGAEEYEE